MTDRTYLSLGLMSGTSMDGIDGAIIRTDGVKVIEELASASTSYQRPFHHALKVAEQAVRQARGDLNKAASQFADAATSYFYDTLNLSSQAAVTEAQDVSRYFSLEPGQWPTLEQVIHHSTDLHAQLVKQLMTSSGLRPEVIGYHGQNLYHNPDERISLQVGDGLRLAQLTGTQVVYDFRRQDIQSGGQGAPFAPLYHQALAVREKLCPAAFVNCGGISNVTFAFGPSHDEVMGFDTGPGNGLVDLFIKQKTNGQQTYDQDGQYGLQGQVHEEVMHSLYHTLQTYVDSPPPKSLDLGDLSLVEGLNDIAFEDAVRTLEAFTADTIVTSLRFIPVGQTPPSTWILAGGGWQNPVIVEEFQQRLQVQLPDASLSHAHELGLDSQALEAQIFAFLAVRSLRGLPLSVPLTTGVSEPMTGGTLVVSHAANVI